MVADVFKKKIKIKNFPLKEGSTKIRIPNIGKIKILGFKKKYTLKSGIRKIINKN